MHVTLLKDHLTILMCLVRYYGKFKSSCVSLACNVHNVALLLLELPTGDTSVSVVCIRVEHSKETVSGNLYMRDLHYRSTHVDQHGIIVYG